MFLDTRGPTITYDGLPIDVDTFIQQSDMVADHSQIICMRAPTAVNERTVMMYYSIELVYNASGQLIKQGAATWSETPPTWLSSTSLI